MARYSIHQGNVLEVLPCFPAESIDLAITSPPYWGLRDYGMRGQLGSEPTMEEYLDDTMKWVNEIWRVLKPTGSFVLNLGDCYLGNAPGQNYKSGRLRGKHRGAPTAEVLKAHDNTDWKARSRPNKVESSGTARFYREKQLLSVSSFAYCRIVSDTDFVCRNEQIWCKPNVPSPIRSRLKHSHEKLFWFVKDADAYYWNAKPWMRAAKARDGKENFTGGIGVEGRKDNRHTVNLKPQHAVSKSLRNNQRALNHAELATERPVRELDYAGASKKTDGTAFNRGSFHAYVPDTIEHSWRVVAVGEKQKGFEASGKGFQLHIAPFPEELIKPWVESLTPPNGTVLDPFLGSGTTMKVARDLRRSCVGVELNPDYIAYAKKRINWQNGLDGNEYEEF